MAYSDGFEERDSRLLKDYCLQNVPVNTFRTVVDCGANVGDFWLALSSRGFDGDYVGFEPSPQEYKAAIKNLPPDVIKNCALWDKEDSMTFFVSSQGADSSLIKPKDFDETITVDCHCLDSIFQGDIDLLKLEAEGAEPEVLMGAEKSLLKTKYVAADLGFERGVEAESPLLFVINWLFERGFVLIDANYDRFTFLFENKKIGLG